MAAKSNFIPWFRAAISADDFESIYQAEVPRIYHFFCYRFGEGPLAEDLTSATFEKRMRHSSYLNYVTHFTELRLIN